MTGLAVCDIEKQPESPPIVVKAGGHYIFSAELWVDAGPKAYKLIRSIVGKEDISIFDVADALAAAGIDVNDNPHKLAPNEAANGYVVGHFFEGEKWLAHLSPWFGSTIQGFVIYARTGRGTLVESELFDITLPSIGYPVHPVPITRGKD